MLFSRRVKYHPRRSLRVKFHALAPATRRPTGESLQILTGDCLDELHRLPDQSIHCCITSPPYWGLRDYGTAQWEGGDAQCDHRAPSRFDYAFRAGLGPTGVQTQASNNGSNGTTQYREACEKCGARRVDLQVGLEKTPEAYIARLVAIFREVRRVLRDDGTLWLNLGDSYNSSGGHTQLGGKNSCRNGRSNLAAQAQVKGANVSGLKTKDMIGIPWRVALALQADGWFLRSDIIEEVEFYCPCGCGFVLEERIWRWSQDREIIWKKRNPMPESVFDRPTRAHEYLFLLSKSQKYHYDAAAIREPCSEDMQRRAALGHTRGALGKVDNSRNDATSLRGEHAKALDVSNGRNKRSVWTISTKPFRGAHFATFPPKLIEPCILAGCPLAGTVLDPFFGAGTTGKVALELNRKCIGIELNPEYVDMAWNRCNQNTTHEATRATPTAQS